MGTDAQREAGKKIYDQKCAQCHGYNGDANSVGKEFFRPQPRDFTTGIFKFRSTANGELPTHEDLKRSIKLGMPYTGMPAWPKFSNEDLSNLAYYLKTFSADFIDYGDVKSLDLPKAPPFSEASAERGRIVYEENQCLDCHGNAGRGDGKSAPTLTDHWGQPIRAADLTKRWTFRGGATREDIYRTFTTGLDGSPMPSYNIQPPEDQWALVDYVYSLGSSDKPNYATMAIATGREGAIDLSLGKSLFDQAEAARFPVVGQVIEPGRAFYPGVNAVSVQAIYNAEDIAIMLTWHDMSAETSGTNSPALDAPLFSSNTAEDTLAADMAYADAAAILLPAVLPEGLEKPYIMFGDSKNPMDIWFADLANNAPQLFTGRGSKNIKAVGDGGLSMVSGFYEGEWHVIYKRSRVAESGISFANEGSFIPVAFSIWDGFNRERGNKRGMTSWYYLYLEPLQKESPLGPMAQTGGITFLVLMGIVAFVRIRYKERSAEPVAD